MHNVYLFHGNASCLPFRRNAIFFSGTLYVKMNAIISNRKCYVVSLLLCRNLKLQYDFLAFITSSFRVTEED